MTTFKTIALTLLSLGALQANAEERVNCHSLGGGYLTQGIKVNVNGEGNFEFELERYTNLEDMRKMGIAFDGRLVKRMTFILPAANCYQKVSSQPQVTLLSCSSGISNIEADFLLLDGTSQRVRLGDNNSVQVVLTTAESVSQDEKTVSVRLGLGRKSPQSTGLGFHLRECR